MSVAPPARAASAACQILDGPRVELGFTRRAGPMLRGEADRTHFPRLIAPTAVVLQALWEDSNFNLVECVKPSPPGACHGLRLDD